MHVRGDQANQLITELFNVVQIPGVGNAHGDGYNGQDQYSADNFVSFRGVTLFHFCGFMSD